MLMAAVVHGLEDKEKKGFFLLKKKKQMVNINTVINKMMNIS